MVSINTYFNDELLITALLVCVHVMQVEGSEPAHDEGMGLVDHIHPGQGGDFDDEGPATLPWKKGKDRSKGDKDIMANMHF